MKLKSKYIEQLQAEAEAAREHNSADILEGALPWDDGELPPRRQVWSPNPDGPVLKGPNEHEVFPIGFGPDFESWESSAPPHQTEHEFRTPFASQCRSSDEMEAAE
jgi:hypothetical protein